MHYARDQMAVLMLLAAMTVGGIACDRESAPTPPAPSAGQPESIATSRPAAPSATQPAAPVAALFVIDEQPFYFPPAKLVLERSDGRMRAMLFSIDPPNALKQNDVGNSFYFNLDLDAASLDDLPGQRVEYRHSSGGDSDRDGDATTGIFIAGGRQILQPLQATVDFFSTDAGETVVVVSGSFRLRDERIPDNRPVQVMVRSRLTPVVKEQGR